MKKLILLDIDNTLFDSPSYKNELFETIASLLEKKDVTDAKKLCVDVYKQCRVASGLFSPQLFLETLEKKVSLSAPTKEKIVRSIFDEQLLQKHIYQEVKETLQILKTKGELGLFSQGEEAIQKAKIKELLHLFTQEHMHIMYSKKELFHTILKHYTSEDIFIIDDALPVLFEVKKHYPHVTVIWMKRGEWANNQKQIEGFTPDAIVTNLADTISIIQ